MSQREDYIERFATIAMKEMAESGVPASITLAQGILESGDGKSELSQKYNNHFGITGENSGKYAVYDDDKPNTKFRAYDSPEESYHDHSKLLTTNPRYSNLSSLAPEDYKGWAKTLKDDGYASRKDYDQLLIDIIEKYDLTKYDKEVLAKKGQSQNQTSTTKQSFMGLKDISDNRIEFSTSSNSSNYSLPLDTRESLKITSLFGNRKAPTAGASTLHNGIDIAIKENTPILSTENNGTIVLIQESANNSAGKYVVVEYPRENGEKVKTSYCHLNQIDVKVGDKVNAGDRLGLSGNTGNSTGAHLHYVVREVSSSGETTAVNPAGYLAEINLKGDLKTKAEYKGKDLLSQYKVTDANNPNIDDIPNEQLSPEEWMKKLLCSEDSGLGLSNSSDPIMDILVNAFTSLMVIAQEIDGQSEDKQYENIEKAVETRSADLTALIPSMNKVVLEVNDDGKSILNIKNKEKSYSIALSAQSLNKLNIVLSDSSLTIDEKSQYVSNVINSIINGKSTIADLASQNFNSISQESSQQQGISLR